MERNDPCPTCGKPLGDVDVRFRTLPADPSDPSTPTGPGRFARSAVVLGIAAVALVVWGFIALSGDGGSDETAVEATPTPALAAAEALDVEGGEVIENTDVALALQVEAAGDTLSAVIGEHKLAYQGADGIVVFSLGVDGAIESTTTKPLVTSTNDILLDLAGLELLNVGDLTFGIDPETTDRVFELSNIGPLVRTPEAFSIGERSEDGRKAIVVATAGGFWVTWVDLPVGAVTIAVPDLGVLVSPPSGGTLLARPGGYDDFSDSRVLAATDTHHIEVRCDDDLSCVPLLLDRVADSSTPVPSEFVDPEVAISIGPDGRWVVLADGADSLLLDVATSVVTPIEISEGASVAWAPDGSFVAWLDPAAEEPILSLIEPATAESVRVDLALLGLDGTSAPSVVVFD